MITYKIMVELYLSKKDIEAGKPYRVADSGFTKDLTLKEATILKSKMPESILRINKIIENKSLTPIT